MSRAKAVTRKKIGIDGKKPVAILKKPLRFDFGELSKALVSLAGGAATANWSEVASATVEALSSIGLSTDPGELVYTLIARALISASFDLMEETVGAVLSELRPASTSLVREIDLSLTDLRFDKAFIKEPGSLKAVKALAQELCSWLIDCGISRAAAEDIAKRLPSYFTHALVREWRRSQKSYEPILSYLQTPFDAALEREWEWEEYAALLERRVNESIFDEAFGLRQIYVPLNAYIDYDDADGKGAGERLGLGRPQKITRKILPLAEQLRTWLGENDRFDAVRVISGGPGSGKSSFARIFAADIASEVGVRVLFIPLHLIDPSKDVADEIRRFSQGEGIFSKCPVDPEMQELNLLLIFDGLDELATQGKASAETARSFILAVERLQGHFNHSKIRLRALFSGREIIIQSNETEFRKPGQILNVLPYYVGAGHSDLYLSQMPGVAIEIQDPGKLLKVDLRHRWWKAYGNLTGRAYEGLPEPLQREDLAEVTAQPLLNYLIALSYTREKIDFSQDVNLNSIYQDLVAAVHERGYEKGRQYGPIRQLDVGQFARVLEEVGLAAWHGDGRSTTVREIEEHCKASGLSDLLDVFSEGARAGVTRLLAAFFFRQHGHRSSGDPTFVFTHKSFGEYLAARRVFRAVERIRSERERRRESPDAGWDEVEALRHWIGITGPAPVTRYLLTFLRNEAKLNTGERNRSWQGELTHLFNHVLRTGLPLEMQAAKSFRLATLQARNSEEALFVVINSCARVSRQPSKIDCADPVAFGAWFRRAQGQRRGPESSIASNCLSYIELNGACLDISDLYRVDLSGSILKEVDIHYSCLMQANLRGAKFTSVKLEGSDLGWADMSRAEFLRCRLVECRLKDAMFSGAKFEQTFFSRRIFEGDDELPFKGLQKSALTVEDVARRPLEVLVSSKERASKGGQAAVAKRPSRRKA